jgi:4-amino-4-deoxy-L-arabinose transferase-like glycosyltransferase
MKLRLSKNITDYFIYFFLLILCFFIFIYKIDAYPLRLWDEARNGINAFEMIHDHNYLVTHFLGQPDTWNTKPPLFIWIVAAFFKVLGINELSLRLPSAVSAVAITLSLYYCSKKIFNNRYVGLLASLILLSCIGFADFHIARSGDYDALLTLFMFFEAVYFFKFLQSYKTNDLSFGFTFLTLGLLTKGIAGALFLPGIFLYALLINDYRKLISDKRLWIGIGVTTFVLSLYYLSREFFNHGYLLAVWNEELFGRYAHSVGSTTNDFWFYWRYLSEFRFRRWFYLYPLTILIIYYVKDKKISSAIKYFYIISLSYLLIISFSSTKQLWYEAPIYPISAMLISYFIIKIISQVKVPIKIFLTLVVSIILVLSLRTNIKYIYKPDMETSYSCNQYGYLFRNKKIDFNNYIGVDDDNWCTPLDFYLVTHGLKRSIPSDIKTGDNILSCNQITLTKIESIYIVKQLFKTDNNCYGLELGEAKK